MGGGGAAAEQLRWTDECQHAFEELKHSLMHPPVLAYSDFNLPFILTTDGNQQCLGVVLSQNYGGVKHIIAFATSVVHGSEKNDKIYSAFKLELCVLIWAITEKCKKFLVCSKFTVLSDYNPPQYLMPANLGAVEQHWIAQLAKYNFKVCYKPSHQNSNADVLLRIPVGTEPDEEDSGKDFIRIRQEEV